MTRDTPQTFGRAGPLTDSTGPPRLPSWIEKNIRKREERRKAALFTNTSPRRLAHTQPMKDAYPNTELQSKRAPGPNRARKLLTNDYNSPCARRLADLKYINETY